MARGCHPGWKCPESLGTPGPHHAVAAACTRCRAAWLRSQVLCSLTPGSGARDQVIGPRRHSPGGEEVCIEGDGWISKQGFSWADHLALTLEASAAPGWRVARQLGGLGEDAGCGRRT